MALKFPDIAAIAKNLSSVVKYNLVIVPAGYLKENEHRTICDIGINVDGTGPKPRLVAIDPNKKAYDATISLDRVYSEEDFAYQSTEIIDPDMCMINSPAVKKNLSEKQVSDSFIINTKNQIADILKRAGYVSIWDRIKGGKLLRDTPLIGIAYECESSQKR